MISTGGTLSGGPADRAVDNAPSHLSSMGCGCRDPSVVIMRPARRRVCLELDN
jgi:hypothetical protein